MNSYTILNFGKHLLQKNIQPGDHVIDATIGNGNDTLTLAQLVGKNGTVYGFDIQAQALIATRNRTKDVPATITLFHDGHQRMQHHIPEKDHGNIKCIIFNLGYLPGSDMSVATQSDSSISALDQSLEILKPGGFVLLTVYPGHTAGSIENDAIKNWVGTILFEEYLVFYYQLVNNTNHPPSVYVIEKRGK